jgi:hypothetical protein
MLQARFNPSDPRLYDPNRDVVHNFAAVVTRVAELLTDQNWEDLRVYLADQQVTEEQLGQACVCFCDFVLQAHAPPYDLEEALQKAGWFELPTAARLAYFACLGLVVGGVYHTGVRYATLKGPAGPMLSAEELVAVSRRAADLLKKPRWRRRLIRWRQRIAAWFRRRFRRNS